MDGAVSRRHLLKSSASSSRSGSNGGSSIVPVTIGFEVHVDLSKTSYASAAALLDALNQALEGEALSANIGRDCGSSASVSEIESALARNNYPTVAPKYTGAPTPKPSEYPSLRPQQQPTPKPTMNPVAAPSMKPRAAPTMAPIDSPTPYPHPYPTPAPIDSPTPYPAPQPTSAPWPMPTSPSMVSVPMSLRLSIANKASLSRECVFAAVANTASFIDEVIV